MNREIEFRGFDGTKWYYGDLEYNRVTGVARIHTYNEDGSYDKQYAVDQDTVGQYTGMRDKHGKKIFEGDIVSRKDSAYGYIDIGIVKYDNSLGAFVIEYDHYERKCKCTFAKSFSDNDGKCTIEIKYTFEILGNNFDKQ